MDLFDKFLKILNSLNKYQVDYILIGGFAVIIYGMPRLTQDIDFLSKQITIPSSASASSTRMRISMAFNATITSCETFENGEVEDYTLNFI